MEESTWRLSDLAREVVEAVAPDELELLPQVTAAWLAGDLAPAGDRIRWRGGAIGAGLGTDLLVTIIYPALAGAVTPLLTAVGVHGWRRMSHRLGRKPRPSDVVISQDVIDQAELVRDRILEDSARLGIPAEQAALIAESAYAALLRHRLGDR